MSELILHAGGTIGGLAAAVFVLYKFAEGLVSQRLKRGSELEDKVESVKESKIEALISLVTEMRRDMALLADRLSTLAGSNNELKARVDGVSANHGTRISSLETEMARIVERFVSLEAKRGKR